MNNIPFNKPFATGQEFDYIKQAITNGHLSGNGEFTKKCQTWLESSLGCQKALLTHSCTAALEMSAILADIQPGDEVIMPSYTFVSTANAFVLRGGIPVFVDIRPDTLNLDESKIEAAITPKTKAIVPVHYAGVGCEMEKIREIAQHRHLLLIEDAAQGVMSSYQDQPLGSLGHLATVSFHETKNVISGEGGALLINQPDLIDRAEIIWEKGTNRSQFFRGQVDKYTWVDLGSSYLPSEVNAAFLWAQLEAADTITQKRLAIWQKYHQAFIDLEVQGRVRRPIIPPNCQHNAHMYYLLLPNLNSRTRLIQQLKQYGIYSVFHYVPLHSSPAGIKYCDTLLEPYCKFEKLKTYKKLGISLSKSIPLDILIEICHGAFIHGRFHRDFNLDKTKSDMRYNLWLKQLYEADSVFGLMYNDDLAGFWGFSDHKIVLHALDEKYRGKGIAKYFWSMACQELFKQGYSEITSSISAANVAVLNLYASLGFNFRNPLDVYHLWLRQAEINYENLSRLS